MNQSHVSNDLRPVVDEVTRRFKGRIDFWYAPRLNEIYFQGRMDPVSYYTSPSPRD